VRRSFVERSIDGLSEAMERALYAESVAEGGGLLQRLDPRVKVAGLAGLIVSSALSANFAVIASIFVIGVVLAALSRVSPATLASRVWIEALAFTGTIAIPAVFLTPGRIVYRIPTLHWPVTAQGLTTAGYLILRVETAATLSLLLVFTTPWVHVLKALRVFRVPVVFVVVLGMSCRYILLMLEAANEMFDSRRSRTVGTLSGPERRHLAVATAGVMLSKAFQMSGEVYLAMQARGFRGEVYLLDDFRMTKRDWAALASFACVSAIAVWASR
jgi:cobalt ECF transporter T component CbiQ